MARNSNVANNLKICVEISSCKDKVSVISRTTVLLLLSTSLKAGSFDYLSHRRLQANGS